MYVPFQSLFFSPYASLKEKCCSVVECRSGASNVFKYHICLLMPFSTSTKLLKVFYVPPVYRIAVFGACSWLKVQCTYRAGRRKKCCGVSIISILGRLLKNFVVVLINCHHLNCFVVKTSQSYLCR